MHNELHRAWKSEKTSETPQPLPRDFYKRVGGYLKGLEEDARSSDDHTLQGRLLAKETEVAKRLHDELRETRLRKIVRMIQNGKQLVATDMTDEEKTLLKTVYDSVTSFRQEPCEKVETPIAQLKLKEGRELAVVRFLQDIPEIVGVDLEIYGPYKKEDVGSLPKQNAQALIRQGVARQIEVKGVA